MRKYLFIFSMLIVWSSTTFAQDDSVRTVTVVGIATTQVIPDNISWFLTVTVRDKDQVKLRTQADEILSQIMTVVDSLGIDHDDIELGKVSIKMHYKYKKRRETEKFSYYELSQRLTIIQNDIEQYDEYWSKLTSIEGVRVGQNFFTSQLEPTRRQLRMDALRSAKQKADDLATVLGGSVGKALTISEFKPNQTRSQIEHLSNYVRGSVKSAKPEKIKMSARVYVVFELE